MKEKPGTAEKSTLESFFTDLSGLGASEAFTDVFALSRPRRGNGFQHLPRQTEISCRQLPKKGASGNFYRDLHKVRIRGIDFA